MRRICVLVAVIVGAATAHVPTQAPSAKGEVVVIDGAKNPEQIPQWYVWGYAFRIFSGGPRELPTSVWYLVSKEERQLVMKQADGVQKSDTECAERAIRTHGLLKQGESLTSVDTKMHAITVECRWKTLHARDRILEGLNPEARIALIKFVEDCKQGITVTIPKNGLARYFEPQ
jgi:hypothetical protein